jgi:GTPase SAR1 family protein
LHLPWLTGHALTQADWETPLYLTTQSENHKTALQLAHDLCSHGAVWSLVCQQRIADQAVPKSDGKEMEAKAKQDAQWRAGLVACITFWVKAYQEGGHGVAEVPVHVVERGAESVKTYVDDFGRSDANELVSRCKVCVLGPTGSGKTSLIRSLAAMQPTLTKHDTLPGGIELLTSTFTEARADQAAHRLDVTFWDFPGQEVHQLAQSLFFSRRTLFVVTVDLPAYMSQLDNTTGLSDDQFEFGMNRFVTTRVFRWVRTILSQQPDAHIMFAGTKEDSLQDPKQAREVWIDLKDRLEDWKQSYIQELQAQFQTDPESNSEATHSTIDRVPSFHVDQDDQTAFTLENLKKKLAGVGTWLVVSSADANSIANGREKVQELLSDAKLGFPMWKTCMQVHEAIKRKCATARASGSERECLEGVIVRLSVLRKQLMREIDSLEREDCEHIIRSLDDLGDVLWFEREDAGELNDYVILDPKLGIDIVNEVINHDFSNDPQGPPQDGFLRHARLQTFPWWREMDIVLTHSFKALLQCFHLVFPAENEEMLPDSDLIVPAFWKSYPPASSRSLLARQQSKLDSIAKNRWCWEYEVPAGIADALYEKLAVQTSTSYLKRAISADCIECACDEFASRITLIDGEGTTDVVRVEVAGKGAEMSWHNMRYYLMKMEMVLEAYPGMTTRRYVVDTRQVMERRYPLEPAVKKLLDTIALGRDEQLVRADFPWFPPDMTWYVRKSWRDIGGFQQLQLDQLLRDKLEVLRKLAIAGDAPRRYPALWSLEYHASERKVVLRMSSDLSGRCFHVPIEIEANPAFLAKYGAVLKVRTRTMR